MAFVFGGRSPRGKILNGAHANESVLGKDIEMNSVPPDSLSVECVWGIWVQQRALGLSYPGGVHGSGARALGLEIFFLDQGTTTQVLSVS